MDPKLDALDIPLLLESLEYARLNTESTQYPTYELKQKRLVRIDAALAKLRTSIENGKER